MPPPDRHWVQRFGALVPGVFVILWATGFVGTRLGLPYAPPLTFLGLRLVIVAGLLLLWAVASGAAWPASRRQLAHLAIVGVLLHGLYLGGVFVAIALGLEVGTSAIIVSVQPLLVAALAGPLLGERVTPRQWLGLALGLAGVAAVVWRKAGLSSETMIGAGLCLVSLLAITSATLLQKRWLGSMPLVTGNAVQFAAAALVVGAAALALEDNRIEWSGAFIFAMTWLVVVLSLGAVALLMLLIRLGAASRVSSLFFLVPPATAVMSWLLFGERLGPVELAGMALVALGVALVNLAGGQGAGGRGRRAR